MGDWAHRAALQLRDRLLMDEWEPHAEPGDEDTLRAHMFRIFDEAHDLLVGEGMAFDEAVSVVRVMFGSSDHSTAEGQEET